MENIAKNHSRILVRIEQKSCITLLRGFLYEKTRALTQWVCVNAVPPQENG